jgi:ribonuclease P protein component
MVLRPLKGYRSFEEVLRSGRRVTSGPLLLAAMPNDGSSDVTFVGVGVPKRVAPKAVVRNRIKRLMRVSIRACLLESSTLHAGVRVVLLWRSAPKHPSEIALADVQHYVRKGLAKLTSGAKA